MSNQSFENENENFQNASSEEGEFTQNQQNERDLGSSIADPEGGDNPLQSASEGGEYSQESSGQEFGEQEFGGQESSEGDYASQESSKQGESSEQRFGGDPQESGFGENTNADPDLTSGQEGSDPYSDSQRETEQTEDH